MAKVSKQIQQLFLRLLNFTPELLAKTQQEAKLQNTSFDAVIRAAVEKHLQDLNVARLREEEEKEAELRWYALVRGLPKDAHSVFERTWKPVVRVAYPPGISSELRQFFEEDR